MSVKLDEYTVVRTFRLASERRNASAGIELASKIATSLVVTAHHMSDTERSLFGG